MEQDKDKQPIAKDAVEEGKSPLALEKETVLPADKEPFSLDTANAEKVIDNKPVEMVVKEAEKDVLPSTEKAKYDPLAAFKKAKGKLSGLPPLKVENTTAKTAEEPESAVENSLEGSEQEKEAQPIDYKDKTEDYDLRLNADSPAPKEETAEQKSARQRLKQKSAQTMVRHGDNAQATLAKVVFDWRASDGVNKAESTRDKLLEKVTADQALSLQEKALLAYAQDFIRQHQQRKESFEEQIHLSEQDKEDLISLLEDYLELKGYEPSPVFMMMTIIGVTLFHNFYTAFTIHPSYNPPSA